MSGFAIKHVLGVEETIRRLDGLKQGVRNRILRRANSKASRLIAKLAKNRLTVSNKAARKAAKTSGVKSPIWPTGILKKSIGVKTYTTGRGVVVAVIGPRRGFRKQVGTRKDGKPIFHDPANIAHLVEYGHGGPHPAPPHPFLRPALDQGVRPAMKIYREEIAAGIAKLGKGYGIDAGEDLF